ncbi:response regulator [Pseudomarimonas arenosa]
MAADPDPDGPLQLADMDEELLDIFLEEGVDILDHSDGMLARLRENPADRELVVGLQRDLHTLKGGARMAGISPIGDLGHAAESLLEAVADGRRELGPIGTEVLERVFDRLHGMVTRIGERKALAMPVTLLGYVDALVRGETIAFEAEEEATAEEVAAAAPVAAEEAKPAVTAPPVSHVAEVVARQTALDVAAEEEDASVRAPQEQIRIRADLLDRLVNYAGEVAIYRARLEQQLGAFRGGLVEMEATTARLREQLRRLEIETEAQIIARYQREQDEGEAQNFDPLELDRFSTLQQLSRALAESAADLTNLQGTLDDLTRQYETLLLQQSRVSSELQEGLMRTRMVPFDSLVPRLRRILRQTGSELGKRAQLKVEGAQGEMDRNVLDRMTAPLEHMLRNALAHGLETPEERAKIGKPEEGTVRIQVAREASEVVIHVTDDGKGIDREAIRSKAMQRGLLAPDAQISDRELFGFILQSGFSTAQTISKIAGRGVGMDVVHNEIKQLGGSLHIESELGKGTQFVIRLPFTLAVTQAVFVKLGETNFAVPITSVQGVARIAPSELEAQVAGGSPIFQYAGEDYAIHDLGQLLGHGQVKAAESLQVPLLLARTGDLRAAISVDQVIGSKEIVVKPTGPQINSIPGIFGATIMGDGSVVVILDVAPLVRRADLLRQAGETMQEAEVAELRQVPLVMVVDDSITMRKVSSRVLERAGYEVMTAKDGVDAIEKMQERVPNAMLLDIEMPRMDGYELATHMRNDLRLRNVPIIMITSRTGEKHRQRAFEIGVDRYLGKPYQEPELMRNVQEVLKVGRGGAG